MQIEQVETLWGPMYVFDNDTGVSQALRDFGEYGAVEVATYLRLLEPGDAFVDVGANIGTISRAIASAGRNLTVIGFEPQPEFHRLACANLIGCERAAVYPLAASDRAGEIRINEVDLRQVGNYGHREIEGQRPSRRMVPCTAVREAGRVGEMGGDHLIGYDRTILAGFFRRHGFEVVDCQADDGTLPADRLDPLLRLPDWSGQPFDVTIVGRRHAA